MFLQDGIYRLALWGLRQTVGDELFWIDVAFAIGFVVEMVVNFFVTAYYTFERKPDKKKAGGFLLARSVNLVCQFAFLHLFVYLSVPENMAGFPSIFLAGVINFFLVKWIFKADGHRRQK